jgi:hypothetical protein
MFARIKASDYTYKCKVKRMPLRNGIEKECRHATAQRAFSLVVALQLQHDLFLLGMPGRLLADNWAIVVHFCHAVLALLVLQIISQNHGYNAHQKDSPFSTISPTKTFEKLAMIGATGWDTC